MKCTNCGNEFEGAFCPFCGQVGTVQNDQNTQQVNHVNHSQPSGGAYGGYNSGYAGNGMPNMGYQQYHIDKCTNCGKDMENNARVCRHCGFAKGVKNRYCSFCGEPVEEGAVICVKCGAPIHTAKSKLITLIFAILFGGFGLSDFYLGYNKYAIIKLALSVALCWTGLVPLGMWIWAMVMAVMIYMGKMPDAYGNELKD